MSRLDKSKAQERCPVKDQDYTIVSSFRKICVTCN